MHHGGSGGIPFSHPYSPYIPRFGEIMFVWTTTTQKLAPNTPSKGRFNWAIERFLRTGRYLGFRNVAIQLPGMGICPNFGLRIVIQ